MADKRIIVAGVVVAVALAGAGFWYAHARAEAARERLTLYGNVDIREVNLGFRVAGRLLRLGVDEGSVVQAGDVIGQLDAVPYQRALATAQAAQEAAQARYDLMRAGSRAEDIAQAEAQASQARASFETAQQDYERVARLHDTGAASQRQFDEARGQRDAAQAALKAASEVAARARNGNRVQDIAAARASLDQAAAEVAQQQLNIDDCQLRAPSPGQIMTRAVEPGAMLAAGSTVFTETLTSPVWVRAYVDEAQLGQVHPGAAVSLWSDSSGARRYHGHVGYISPTAEFTPKSVETPDLRTDLVYRLRIVVDDADVSLRQGMPVTVDVPLNVPPNVQLDAQRGTNGATNQAGQAGPPAQSVAAPAAQS